jgi:glycosyltransferase involved in cell wall biosynthesis
LNLTVGVVTPSFYPMIGGIESYVRGIGRELVKFGLKVHVYTPDSVMRRRIETKEEDIDGILVHRIRVPIEVSYRLKIWPGLLQELLSRRHDLIHIYSHDLYAILGLAAAKSGSLPLVITTYGPFESHSEHGLLKSSLFVLYDALVTPSLFKKADRVYIRYPELAGWVRSFGLRDSRIRLEPSGMPSSYLRSGDGRKFRSRLPVKGPLILYLGRISRQKGIQYLVRAMKDITEIFPSAKLLLVGPDYAGYTSYLKVYANTLGLGGNLIFFGPTTDEEEEFEIIAACDVFVMPSSFEGFSQAVLKALGQGKPVVVSDVGGLPYEVDYGSCGIISKFGDSAGLAMSILRILESPSLASELGQKGRERASGFTFELLAKRLLEDYQVLVSS